MTKASRRNSGAFIIKNGSIIVCVYKPVSTWNWHHSPACYRARLVFVVTGRQVSGPPLSREGKGAAEKPEAIPRRSRTEVDGVPPVAAEVACAVVEGIVCEQPAEVGQRGCVRNDRDQGRHGGHWLNPYFPSR